MISQVEPEKGSRDWRKQSWTLWKRAIYHFICEEEETSWQRHKNRWARVYEWCVAYHTFMCCKTTWMLV